MLFKRRREQRDEEKDGKCPKDRLDFAKAKPLDFWLSRFVVKARHKDGKPFPSVTINNILTGLYHSLYRYAKSKVPSSEVVRNLMDEKNAAFQDIREALQACFRILRKAGVAASVKHATIVSEEEEDLLWESKVISEHDPLESSFSVSMTVLSVENFSAN